MSFASPVAMSFLPHLHHYHRDHDDNGQDTEPFPEVPKIEMTAPSAPNSPTSSSTRRRDRDTGFPEPFNDVRNTTLPYPGADLSPNARITMDDLLVSDPFSRKRSRRSRLSKHKRTVSYGRITPQFEALQSVLSVVDSSVGSPIREEDQESAMQTSAPPAGVPATPMSASFSSPRTSNQDSDSFRSRREDETPPSSPERETSSQKRGFLGRLRRMSRG